MLADPEALEEGPCPECDDCEATRCTCRGLAGCGECGCMMDDEVPEL